MTIPAHTPGAMTEPRRERPDTGVDVDAAVSAYLAWKNLSEATTPVGYAYAVTELNEAMGDLATWLPGYDYETGTIPQERDNC